MSAYKIGDYKVARQEFFERWIMVMRKTWYGWKVLARFYPDNEGRALAIRYWQHLEANKEN